MFERSRNQSLFISAFNLVELIYHSAVRGVRKSHRNALVGLIINVVQSIIMVATFFIVFAIFGIRTAPLRGDYIMYILTGIALFMVHTKSMGAVFGAEDSTSPIMNHAPLNTIVTTSGAALGALYVQLLSLLTILLFYHLFYQPLEIQDPVGALGVILLSWFSGVAIGLVLLAVKPWFPNFVSILQKVYSRANMFTSGKMFVANTLPVSLLVMFSWNPLFHCIDQMRGFVFENYTPRNSSLVYPIYFSLGVLTLGMMAEFFTRKSASLSWKAGR